MISDHQINIHIATQFLNTQSSPKDSRYAFAYTITISNLGIEAVKLLSRRWLITDGNGKTQEVLGEGVVGEQPLIQPGNSFRYTSGALLKTSMGTMEGSYQMINQG